MRAFLVHVHEFLVSFLDLRLMRSHQDLVEGRKHTFHRQVMHSERLPFIIFPGDTVVIVDMGQQRLQLARGRNVSRLLPEYA